MHVLVLTADRCAGQERGVLAVTHCRNSLIHAQRGTGSSKSGHTKLLFWYFWCQGGTQGVGRAESEIKPRESRSKEKLQRPQLQGMLVEAPS